MKLQQLISAGFAITAVAAAAVPAVGWTLLGEVMEPPAVSAQASTEVQPFLMADASLERVLARRKPERERIARESIR
jgi:hypothetical protein